MMRSLRRQRLLIFSFLSGLFFWGCRPGVPPVEVALIEGGNPSGEAQAWKAFAESRENWRITPLTWESIVEGKARLSRYEVLWCHQLDTVLSDGARAAGKEILQYVGRGGRLLLDMESVRLLHHWAIEPKPFQTQTDTIRDEGFGRPLGFHAFKAHPLFAGLHGGAYPWKSKEDHIVRQTGFFGKELPAHPEAHVVAVGWTYITLHDSSKVVLEYPLGEGNILAVGAYTYFEPDNYNRHELVQFFQNAVDYLAGRLAGPVYYWNYEEPVVQEKPLPHPDRTLQAERPWNLPVLSISMEVPSGDDSFFDLAGRRILVMGRENGGIDEIWTHPFMAARDFQAGLLINGRMIWLKDLNPKVTISPELLMREYRINGLPVREILTVSFDRPIAVVHYEFPDELDFDGLVVQSTFNARFMWPYDASATRSVFYDYRAASRSLNVTAQDGTLVSLMSFSHSPAGRLLGRFDGFRHTGANGFEGIPTEKLQLGAHFFFDRKQIGRFFNLAIAGSSEGPEALWPAFEEEAPQLDTLYAKTNRYYRQLLEERLMPDTPDPVFNAGYRWALARTDQMFQTTPGLGTTHMAGFGTTARGWNGRHAVSGRPGYAWYFGRDAAWSGMAVNAYGDFAWVKEMLKVFADYQSLNGKIYHELTTSGAVHYDAADATPLYVVLAAHYFRYSGDLEFIRDLWPSLQKAMDFCYSTDTDGDGLIENTDVGHGWIEGGALFGTHTELYLAGSWAACLESAAYMAQSVGNTQLAEKYRTDARKVREIIDRDFWNPSGEYFNNGKMRDGSFMDEATVLQSVPVYLQAVQDTGKARRAISAFSGPAMTTDWGIRMIAEDNPKFNPRSYHAGMVWPLYGGWAALAEYETGAFNSAFFHMYANLINYRYWGKGSVEETLHGSEFRPAGVCSHQCWSETMVILPVIEGMLGLKPDAAARSLVLSPRFPVHWDEVEVRNIRIGKGVLDLSWNREKGKTTIQLKTRGEDDLTLDFFPAFPLGAQFKQVQVNGKSILPYFVQGAESVSLILEDLELNPGSTVQIGIDHSGGIGLLPLTVFPEPGSTSLGARIIRQSLKNAEWSAIVEGLSGEWYTAELWSEEEIRSVENAQITGRQGNRTGIRFQCPKEKTKYSRCVLRVKF